MNQHSDNRGMFTKVVIAILLLVALFQVKDAVFRDMWFDEALTATNFMLPLGAIGIYRNYVIPNNQIFYTLLLKAWHSFYPGSLSIDLYWRLLSAALGLATTVLMFLFWRKRNTGAICFPLVLGFVCSMPFVIYATAIRGYMLSMLLVLIAWHCARRWTFAPSWKNGIGYFFAALLAVGTIPTNLLALGGAVIFFFPYYGFRRIFTRRFLFLALAPPAAALLFYLPLVDRVLRIMKLREGWASPGAEMLMTYAGFALPLLPLLLPALAGWTLFFTRRGRRKYLWLLLIPLIPVFVSLVREPTPFPRVYLCLWPLWLLLTGGGMLHFAAWLKIRCRLQTQHLKYLSFGVAAAVFAWALALPSFSQTLSTRWAEGNGLDDYFSPYYMRPDYQPYNTLRKIRRINPDVAPTLFLSFNSRDTLLFYGRLIGIAPDKLLYDPPPPHPRVTSIPDQTLVVLCSGEDSADNLKSLEERFGLKKLKLLFRHGSHLVFVATR